MGKYVDLNNVVIFGAEDQCGSVNNFSIGGPNLAIDGQFDASNGAEWTIVAADKYRRFVNVGTTDKKGAWTVEVNLRKLHHVSQNGALILYGLRPDTRQLYPLANTVGLGRAVDRYLAKIQEKPVAEMPSHREQYIQDIVDATKMRYVSTSNESGIITGNNYQSLALEKVLREGTRTGRDDFLRQVNFTGKSVLDIGANTGEMSRKIRLLGADLVDGVEYDSFFVETGRMVNGVVGATRVSLFQGDATHPGFYEGKKYDMVVALSVFVYIKGVMAELAEMTDVLVFETHTLDHGLKMYLDAVTPHFPVYQHVGYSQMNPNPRRSRAFLVFAKNEAALKSAFTPRHLKMDSYFKNDFLEKHGTTTPKQFPKWAKKLRDNTDMEQLLSEPLHFGSSSYFTTYILGFLEYQENGGTVDEDNIFVQRYVDAIESGDLDEKLKPMLSDKENFLLKVTAKYRDFEYCLAGDFHKVPLIYLALDEDGNKSFTDKDGQEFKASNIDGHHRFFLGQLLRLKQMMYMTSERRPNFSEKIKTTYSLS